MKSGRRLGRRKRAETMARGDADKQRNGVAEEDQWHHVSVLVNRYQPLDFLKLTDRIWCQS